MHTPIMYDTPGRQLIMLSYNFLIVNLYIIFADIHTVRQLLSYIHTHTHTRIPTICSSPTGEGQ